MRLPPITQVAAALRTTTELLAQELAAPTERAAALVGIRVAHRPRRGRDAGCVVASPRIGCAGKARKAGSGFCAGSGSNRSGGIARSCACWMRSIRMRAAKAWRWSRSRARRCTRANIYAAGERPMGDIDLLIRMEDAPAISRVLDACGYAAAFAIHRHQAYQPRAGKPVTAGILGEHVDNPIKIEVHTRIAEQLPVASTDITRFLFPSAAHPGLNEYSSAAALMMHLLLHAAGNIRARALRLIQLHDIALLAERLNAEDWEESPCSTPGRPDPVVGVGALDADGSLLSGGPTPGTFHAPGHRVSLAVAGAGAAAAADGRLLVEYSG